MLLVHREDSLTPQTTQHPALPVAMFSTLALLLPNAEIFHQH